MLVRRDELCQIWQKDRVFGECEIFSEISNFRHRTNLELFFPKFLLLLSFIVVIERQKKMTEGITDDTLGHVAMQLFHDEFHHNQPGTDASY